MGGLTCLAESPLSHPVPFATYSRLSQIRLYAVFVSVLPQQNAKHYMPDLVSLNSRGEKHRLSLTLNRS
jgi:hypothetical protein